MERQLIGKTITSAKIEGIDGYDDIPFLHLEFSDGTKCTIIADYGGYTGNSLDEYPAYISVGPITPIDSEPEVAQ